MALGKGLGEVASEFEGGSLGDTRLDERLRRIAPRLAAAPDESFPDQMVSEADQEALYRFLGNPKVTMDGLLEPHIRRTHERMAGQATVRIVHDTTPFRFEGDREGLGVLAKGAKGFYAHIALAIAAGDTREPLGVVGARPYIHTETDERRARTRPERAAAVRDMPRTEKESSRWEKLAIHTSSALPKGVRAIHVMDQEADDFALIAALQEAGLSYVVRGYPDRVTKRGAGRRTECTVRQELETEPVSLFRTVRITERTKKQALAGRHPERLERDAELSVRWGVVTLPRPQHAQADALQLTLYAVHVFEPNPPEGQDPVEWMLFTSEVVTSLEQATEVVDHYRARWMIEEYFKALKTGCAFEKRQLTSYDSLVRALALFVPLAWRLLVLRHLGREPKPRLATDILDEQQLLLLAALLARRDYKRFPVTDPSVRDVMLAIASLGGHIRNNGDPGWIVLGRGLRRFVEAEAVWRMARETSDQS